MNIGGVQVREMKVIVTRKAQGINEQTGAREVECEIIDYNKYAYEIVTNVMPNVLNEV